MKQIVQRASAHALANLPSPPDGHCVEALNLVLDYLAARGVEAGIRAYDAPRHIGPHFTIEIDGVEYDPTIAHANWSRPLHVPRGKLYIVTGDSPHRRWHALTTDEIVRKLRN